MYSASEAGRSGHPHPEAEGVPCRISVSSAMPRPCRQKREREPSGPAPAWRACSPSTVNRRRLSLKECLPACNPHRRGTCPPGPPPCPGTLPPGRPPYRWRRNWRQRFPGGRPGQCPGGRLPPGGPAGCFPKSFRRAGRWRRPRHGSLMTSWAVSRPMPRLTASIRMVVVIRKGR